MLQRFPAHDASTMFALPGPVAELEFHALRPSKEDEKSSRSLIQIAKSSLRAPKMCREKQETAALVHALSSFIGDEIAGLTKRKKILSSFE